MKIFLLTDIPVWVQPLQEALVQRGVEVIVGANLGLEVGADIIVNRLSTAICRTKPEQLLGLRDTLRQWESDGRNVINGSCCLEIGFSKLKQFEHFLECGVCTPQTRLAKAGRRALPGVDVLLKPSAGGFGKGIRMLRSTEAAPADLDPSVEWIEQEQIEPADGMVHRIELIGDQILYDAATPSTQGDYNYCLAQAGERSILAEPESLHPSTIGAVKKVAQLGGLQLGSIEYFLRADGSTCFFDFNPVSSFHPNATDWLGIDPIQATADFIERCKRDG